MAEFHVFEEIMEGFHEALAYQHYGMRTLQSVFILGKDMSKSILDYVIQD